ncbi:MAG: CsbD family protein [Gemmobacter sp.]
MPSLTEVSHAQAEYGKTAVLTVAQRCACMLWPAVIHSGQERESMDKDRIKGTVKQAAGSVKAKVGEVTGNTSLEAEGKVQELEGKLQKTYGKAKDALKKD